MAEGSSPFVPRPIIGISQSKWRCFICSLPSVFDTIQKMKMQGFPETYLLKMSYTINDEICIGVGCGWVSLEAR